MSCSRIQHGDACGDRTQDLSLRSPTLKRLDEQHYVPSVDALRLHWQMPCWVAKVWKKANNFMVINDHGTRKREYGKKQNKTKGIQLWTEDCSCSKSVCKDLCCGYG